MTKSLLAFDTDRIKNYVFATGKLKEIRGASAILDELNRDTMVDVVKKLGGNKIYANGGSGLFIIDSNQTQNAIAEIEKLYHQKTYTASITGAMVELPPDYKAGDNIQPHFQTLGYRLRAAKDNKPSQSALVTHPYLRFCDSCGTEYAEYAEYAQTEDTNKPVLLCASCKTKRDKDSEIKASIHLIVKDAIAHRAAPKTGLWATLIPNLVEHGYQYLEGYDRPDDFEALAKMSTPGNYIGLIYADGDSMGKALEALKSDADFKTFSEDIDDGVYQAVAKAIAKHLQPGNDKKVWPFDILLLGGDDLVMVTPANKTLEVGLTVMEQFTQLTGKNLSVGIAIAHANYPFGQLLSLAETTLKFAKKEGAKRRQSAQEWVGGLLNFVVVSSANHLEFGEYYNQDLTAYANVSDEMGNKPKDLFRTLRPYNAADFKKLLRATRSEPIAKMPRSKLQQLRHALFKSKNQAMIDGLTMLFHWHSEKQRKAIQKLVNEDFTPRNDQNLPEHGQMFPWYQVGSKADPEFYTPLLDLVEIFNFVSGANQEEAND